MSWSKAKRSVTQGSKSKNWRKTAKTSSIRLFFIWLRAIITGSTLQPNSLLKKQKLSKVLCIVSVRKHSSKGKKFTKKMHDSVWREPGSKATSTWLWLAPWMLEELLLDLEQALRKEINLVILTSDQPLSCSLKDKTLNGKSKKAKKFALVMLSAIKESEWASQSWFYENHPNYNQEINFISIILFRIRAIKLQTILDLFKEH